MLRLSYLAADGKVHKIETKNLQPDSTEHSAGELGERGRGMGKYSVFSSLAVEGFSHVMREAVKGDKMAVRFALPLHRGQQEIYPNDE